ncbi:MAG: nucleotide exchange factor GrpE [Nocardioides sp.]
MTSAHDGTNDGTHDGTNEGSFGDAAGEMPNETEVEAPLQQEGASAPAGDTAPGDDISGISDWLEEGGPLEPSDLEAGEDAAAGEDVEGVEGAESDELVVAVMALEERTLDLQRLQAEFLNYKRRVERDRDLIKQNATYAALAPITEVLDTIDRAREHGEVDAGLTTVADQLERTVASSGLIKFGAPGEAFDPNVHEALSSLGPDPEATVTTVKQVVKAGYKIGDRVVRAAQVLTVEPA